MTPRATQTLATYALLCVAGGVSFIMPDSLSIPDLEAAPVTASIELTGAVGDVGHGITLEDDGTGIFAYHGDLREIADRRRDADFTYTIVADFTYRPGGMFIELVGDADTRVLVNDLPAPDAAPRRHHFELDRLQLEPGARCTLQVSHDHRRSSLFRIRTNVRFD